MIIVITVRLIYRASKVKRTVLISWRTGPQDVSINTSDTEAASSTGEASEAASL